MKRIISLVLLFLSTVGILSLEQLVARAYSNRQVQVSNCEGKEDCLTNPNCLCWCAFKPGWRNKIKGQDDPQYIENDPYGHHCYCAPRDIVKQFGESKAQQYLK